MTTSSGPCPRTSRDTASAGQASAQRKPPRILVLAAYSAAAGFVSLAAGAAASLAAAPVPEKMILWAAVSAACSVAAGLAYDTPGARKLWLATCRCYREALGASPRQ